MWVLSQPRAIIEAHDATELQAKCAEVEQLADKLHTILLLDYELGYWLEPASDKVHATPINPPFTAIAFTAAHWLGQQDFDQQLDALVNALPEHEKHAGIMNVQRGREINDYRRDIERILDNIGEGNCYQINYTWQLSFDRYGSPLALYHRLRQRQSVRYGAFVQLAARTVLSLSPELFLQKRGNRLLTRPMKGTALRGATSAEDELQTAMLQQSVKDRAENVMIVDLIRNDLGRVALPGKVKVESLFDIESYTTILQMVSEISAEVGQVSLYEILQALFPCGSITGAPKIEAMRLIQLLEDVPRHLYTGSIGHCYPGGDFTFNVAIRTLELDSGARGRLGIGSGIVADSEADQEYSECLAKARFVTQLPVDFELIETLCYEQGSFPYLKWHLDRLSQSAKTFDFHFDQAKIIEALRAGVADIANRSRVRLSLAKSGDTTVISTLLTALAATPQVVIAEHKLDSENIFLQHKTTVRGVYDDVLLRLRDQGDCFDALFFNERDELCEGARSNVFIVKNHTWYTPPVACGVLNGVMRRIQLERDDIRIEEKVLYRDDLLDADEIWLSNAARGVFRCTLATEITTK